MVVFQSFVIIVFVVAFVWMIVVAPEARQSPSARGFSHEGHEGHDVLFQSFVIIVFVVAFVW
jgi:hypothetical protein